MARTAFKLLPDISGSLIDFQHLQFAGCGDIQVTDLELETLFQRVYPGLFMSGFTYEDSSSQQVRESLRGKFLIPCLNDQTKLQVNAINLDTLQKKFLQSNLIEEEKQNIINLFNTNIMQPHEVLNKCIQLNPTFDRLFSLWKSTSFKSFLLTSVGIAIGQTNFIRYDATYHDLALWMA
ncbi:MAG: hypothetical protein HC933_04025 [Pleurocapsa sp. SU_196_0]|nr:hypothetical protein [Pleurocapsa sp. SU_196_0]